MDKMHVEETWMKRKTSATTYFATTLKTFQNIKCLENTVSDDNDCEQNVQKLDERISFLNDSTLSEYPDKRALENGLFLDPNYYLSCARENAILSRYNYDQQKI